MQLIFLRFSKKNKLSLSIFLYYRCRNTTIFSADFYNRLYNRYLDKIAEYLKVPVEYLLNPVSAGSKNEYSLRENQLIEQYRRLAEDKKIEIERKMGYLASLQEFENEQ